MEETLDRAGQSTSILRVFIIAANFLNYFHSHKMPTAAEINLIQSTTTSLTVKATESASMIIDEEPVSKPNTRAELK